MERHRMGVRILWEQYSKFHFEIQRKGFKFGKGLSVLPDDI